MFMKKIMTILWTLSAVLAVSCNKEVGMIDKVADEVENSDYDFTATIYIDKVRQNATRAIDTEDTDDDKIEGIDLYIFDSEGNNLEHYALSDKELSEKKMHIQRKSGVTENYLFLANLDSETAEWLAGLTADEFSENAKGHIPLSAGNFSPHKIVMGGTAKVEYIKDTIITVDMYRYQSRLDLDKIVVDFEDEELMNKDVFVKNIIIANSFNALMFMDWRFPFGNPGSLFGYHYGFTDAGFGGNMTGYTAGVSLHSSWWATVSLEGASGKLAETPLYLINGNIQKKEGVLNIDAPESLYEATIQSYDIAAGEGQVCSAADPEISHTLKIGKSFYFMSGKFNRTYSDIVCTYDEQDYTIKLIIELSIDDETHFYPIQMLWIQPNTNYKIDTITIKSKGSKYSNFYEKSFEVSFPFAVVEWEDVSIGNIEVGYKDGNKEVY